ncbi:hypothetical protein ACFLVI_03485 [Chloroflexota bacterium]
MAWLKAIPKQPSSIMAALSEIKQAVEALKEKKQGVINNEISLEYPRESRVKMYHKQSLIINNVLNTINRAITKMKDYPNKEESSGDISRS